MMIEYVDADERKIALAQLIGIEDKTWVQVAGHDKVYAIADEDMARDNAEKTSSVHFLRFELTPAMCTAIQAGNELSVGIDHENYQHQIQPVVADTFASLAADLN